MVGRRSLLVTKRSLRSAEMKMVKRPKRTVQVKVVDDTVGLSRREEQELNKALYASLQESRRSRSMPILPLVSNKATVNIKESGSSEKQKHIERKPLRSSLHKSTRHSTGSHSYLKPILTKKTQRPFRSSTLSPKRLLRRATSQRHMSRSTSTTSSTLSRSSCHTPVANVDESSQDSVRSSSSSVNGSKSYFDRKIHAQRKFAQGCSLPGTPSSTPVKSNNTPVKLLSSRIPKTEDFLTFLCLRGTSLLPPHLDFFNFSREEIPYRDESSRFSSSSASKYKRQRESTPDSSSSGGANEEVAEAAGVATPPMEAAFYYLRRF